MIAASCKSISVNFYLPVRNFICGRDRWRGQKWGKRIRRETQVHVRRAHLHGPMQESLVISFRAIRSNILSIRNIRVSRRAISKCFDWIATRLPKISKRTVLHIHFARLGRNDTIKSSSIRITIKDLIVYEYIVNHDNISRCKMRCSIDSTRKFTLCNTAYSTWPDVWNHAATKINRQLWSLWMNVRWGVNGI